MTTGTVSWLESQCLDKRWGICVGVSVWLCVDKSVVYYGTYHFLYYTKSVLYYHIIAIITEMKTTFFFHSSTFISQKLVARRRDTRSHKRPTPSRSCLSEYHSRVTNINLIRITRNCMGMKKKGIPFFDLKLGTQNKPNVFPSGREVVGQW